MPENRRPSASWSRLAALCGLMVISTPVLATDQDQFAGQREDFKRAWQSAATGDRNDFRQIMPTLQDYVLYPYLRYEDLRQRRTTVSSEEMSEFLSAHEGWAFTAGLRTSWLRTMGKRRRWDDLIRYGGESNDVRVRCQLAHARISSDDTDTLLRDVQALWSAGKSQPDECDPAFVWLIRNDGVTPGLAWVRAKLAMEARNPGMLDYLVRFFPEDEKKWAQRWRQNDREGYRRLDKAASWTDSREAHDIVRYGLGRLARSDPDRAAVIFGQLEGVFTLADEDRGFVLREIAIWSAVEDADLTLQRMAAIPASYRDGRVLEWWARFGLAREDWAAVTNAISMMPVELKTDGRWRYWEARAQQSLGNTTHGLELMDSLANEATYHGFLAADQLDRPYAICPENPDIDAAALDDLRQRSDLLRAIELRRAGIRNWARSEWQLAVGRLDKQGLRHAAALAIDSDWYEMAIFALGNSGDLKWYEWRFPLHHQEAVEQLAKGSGVDSAWVLGLMRSESAMAEDAISSAGARGLMQIMPATATRLASQHAIQYSGRQQLLQADQNILMGTLYLQDLMNKFQDNPVLVTGAYNAGPGSVNRWLKEDRASDPTIWIETLNYYETRDYIPRVLAFATIYDWRMNIPIQRITSRMPQFDSSSMIPKETTEAVCLTSEG